VRHSTPLEVNGDRRAACRLYRQAYQLGGDAYSAYPSEQTATVQYKSVFALKEKLLRFVSRVSEESSRFQYDETALFPRLVYDQTLLSMYSAAENKSLIKLF